MVCKTLNPRGNSKCKTALQHKCHILQFTSNWKRDFLEASSLIKKSAQLLSTCYWSDFTKPSCEFQQGASETYINPRIHGVILFTHQRLETSSCNANLLSLGSTLLWLSSLWKFLAWAVTSIFVTDTYSKKEWTYLSKDYVESLFQCGPFTMPDFPSTQSSFLGGPFFRFLEDATDLTATRFFPKLLLCPFFQGCGSDCRIILLEFA